MSIACPWRILNSRRDQAMDAVQATGGPSWVRHAQAARATAESMAASDGGNAPATPSPSAPAAAPGLSPPSVGMLVSLQGDGTTAAGGQTGAQLQLPQISLMSSLTPADQQFISAAMGSGASPAATDASENDAGATAQPPFVLQVAADRMSGRLAGDITAAYFDQLASIAEAAGQAIDPQVLHNAHQYLSSQDPSSHGG